MLPLIHRDVGHDGPHLDDGEAPGDDGWAVGIALPPEWADVRTVADPAQMLVAAPFARVGDAEVAPVDIQFPQNCDRHPVSLVTTGGPDELAGSPGEQPESGGGGAQ